MNSIQFCVRWARFLVGGLSLLWCSISDSLGSEDEPWKLTFRDDSSNDSRVKPLIARISPDSRLAAISCDDKSIRLWDLVAGQELRRLVGHTSHPTSMSFSPDGKRLVSCASGDYPDPAIRVWSLSTGEQLYEHREKPGRAAGLVAEYHPSGKYFMAGVNRFEESGAARAYTIDQFDAVSFRPGKQLNGVRDSCKRLAFSSKGDLVLLGRANTGIWDTMLANLQTGRVSELAELTFEAVISGDGRYVAGISDDGEVIVVDAGTSTEVRRFVSPNLRGGSSQGPSFRRLAFEPGSHSLIATTDNNWLRLDLSSGEIKENGSILYSSKGFIVISPDGQRMIEVDGGGDTIIWNLKNNQRLARLYCLKPDKHWAVETTSGYFQHSDNVTAEFTSSLKRDEKLQYKEKFRSSMMVARLLVGMTLEDAERLPENSSPPSIAIKIQDTQQDYATVLITAAATTPGAVLETVHLAIDGRVLRDSVDEEKSPQAASVTASSAVETDAKRSLQSQKHQFEIRVPFPPGLNSARIQGIATDSLGQESTSETLTIKRPRPVQPVPGRLFVLAVGVSDYDDPSLKLQFSHLDAEELSATLLKQKGLAFGDVQVQVYVNKQATVTNLKEGLAWLQRSCTASDVAVILFSGHGIQKERGLYYVTHEANLNGVQYTCLNWETVAETLSNTKARQILFLTDVCHAGSFAKSDLIPQQELAKKLQQKAGVMVFASSRGEEKSLELKVWGHGAFVRSLLDGLDGKADLNKDGNITISELQKAVTAQVIEMTGDRQHPELPGLGRFDPDLVIAKTPR
jgi:WD40 repeat protein